MDFLRRGINTALLLVCLGVLSGCEPKPVPPEVGQAGLQEHGLWRSGAELYAPEDFERYRAGLRKAKEILIKEKAGFPWFRDYEESAPAFRAVLAEGELLGKKMASEKAAASSGISEELSFLSNRIEKTKRVSSLINEGSIARASLTRAEVLVHEAQRLRDAGKYREAQRKLDKASFFVRSAVESVLPIISRYADRAQISRWKTWVEDTVRASRESGSHAIVVSKLDRRLMLYKNGKLLKTYPVGIGINGSNDKRHAGDRATPEGRYRIIKKLPKSRYFKALLINYPNEEDKRQFAEARTKGLIPRNVGIGSLIEIHGGGKEGMTLGCVSLENKQMEELYGIVETGTPVTIVGATEHENSISSMMEGF